MKIVVDVKKSKNGASFGKNDVLIYDGKEWYITTKEELFQELESRFNEAVSDFAHKYTELEHKFAELSQNYNTQMSKLIPILDELLEGNK